MTNPGDIPAVESEIGLITETLGGHWHRTAREGIDEVEAELARQEDDGFSKADAAAIALLLLLLRSKVDEAPSGRRHFRIREAARRLIIAGIETSGLRRGRLKLRGPTIMRAAERAALDLEFLSRARIRENQIEERLDRLLREFRTREEARQTRAERVAIERRRDELKDRLLEDSDASPAERRSAKRELETARQKRAREHKEFGRRLSADREDWGRRLRQALLDRQNALSRTIVDAWAYRVFNVGRTIAGRNAGVVEWVAVNPNDDRTTAFCRWVHGRVVRIEAIESSLAEFTAARLADDKARAIAALPFIAQGNGGAKGARAFGAFWGAGQVPPYHWRCRTVLVPRVRSRRRGGVPPLVAEGASL